MANRSFFSGEFQKIRVCAIACAAIAICIAPTLLYAQIQWHEKESEHFRVVYHDGHSHLVDHILHSAESALKRLSEVFHYSPTEKIIINTYDMNDYGAGAATSVPGSYIWLDIAPIEPGYENIPYNERLQWLISHELVHVVVNDLATNAEAFHRSIFSKVAPEQVQPLSIFYGLLTNYGRYTPRWHQEGIAVFLETWLSGGFGRTMGSFDEMYFRCLVAEGKVFPSDIELETQTPNSSFLVETNYYLFGGRFAAYLALAYGPDKLLQWYTPSAGDFYTSFTQKFENIFGLDFRTAWQQFAHAEQEFQVGNLDRLKSSPITRCRRLTDKPIGAVSQPHLDATGTILYWGEHRPHHLAAIQKFHVVARSSKEIATLPTPSIHQVTSTAFDAGRGLFFFTTNNNQFYRDIWMLNVKTGSKRLLFEDCRVGHLTVSPSTHELWGIRHRGGTATLVWSAYPYDSLKDVVRFEKGEEILGLAIDKPGTHLAAVLHKPNGEQSIVVIECERVKRGQDVTYAVVSDKGSPENPSWSPDNKTIFWNAYTNGVSNIYRKHVDRSTVEPVSHTLTGLFKPVYLHNGSLFAFEFSSDGFYPVIIPNISAKRLPAIKYLGQEVYEKYSSLAALAVKPPTVAENQEELSQSSEYSSLSHLKVVSLFPVMSGFQSQKMLGLFVHVSDPTLTHDFTVEAGVTPFGENVQPMRFHLKMKYEYEKEIEVGWEHNGPDFFDLFNKRKRGTLGDKIRVANTHYWVYDNPQKLKQLSEIVLYTNVTSINDNIVKVSQPDFVIAQTAINSQYLRRSIGSSDFESGNEFNLALMFFASNPKKPQSSINLYAEWDNYSTVLADHNVLHFKLAAGYHHINNRLLQSRFYFGGFGNRALENVNVKQFRKVFSFPGIPVFSLGSDRFGKLMLENNFPPIRFGDVSFGQHFLNHIDASVFSQAIIGNSERWYGVDVGFQANLVIKHWFNLESTVSAGVARAWVQGIPTNEWFISYKLLKN